MNDEIQIAIHKILVLAERNLNSATSNPNSIDLKARLFAKARCYYISALALRRFMTPEQDKRLETLKKELIFD